MPRPTRIEYPGALYYIATQSMPDQMLFHDDIDRRRFLDIIDAAVKRYSLLLHAFTLLDDGYRLLVETPQGNLTKAMQYMNSHYTAYANTRRKQAKQIFKGRYMSTVVEKQRYLLKLCRYIHMLPVYRDFAREPNSYPWSSHPKYVLPNDQPPEVYTRDVMSYFGGAPRRNKRRYQQYIEACRRSEIAPLTLLLKKTRVLGSPQFAKNIEKTDQQPVVGSIDPGLIIDRIAEFFKVEKSSILDNKTKPNHPRNAAIYLTRNMTDTPLEQLGEMFGVGPSSVCNTAKRVEAHRRSEESLAKMLRDLENIIRRG